MTKNNELVPALNMPVLNIAINPDATPDQAMSAVDTVCDALSKWEASTERLRVLLGRLMAEVKDKKLYKPQFSTFEEFTQEIVKKHRLSRSTVRDSIMIVRRLPGLEPEDAEKMPLTNLTLAARAAKNMEPKAVTGLLRSAARLSIVAFRDKVADLLPSKKVRPFGKISIRIVVGKGIAARWEMLTRDSDPAKIFAALVSEASRSVAA